MHVCIYVYMYVYIYIYIHIFIHTYTHTYTYASLSLSTYIYIYIYVMRNQLGWPETRLARIASSCLNVVQATSNDTKQLAKAAERLSTPDPRSNI